MQSFIPQQTVLQVMQPPEVERDKQLLLIPLVKKKGNVILYNLSWRNSPTTMRHPNSMAMPWPCRHLGKVNDPLHKFIYRKQPANYGMLGTQSVEANKFEVGLVTACDCLIFIVWGKACATKDSQSDKLPVDLKKCSRMQCFGSIQRLLVAFFMCKLMCQQCRAVEQFLSVENFVFPLETFALCLIDRKGRICWQRPFRRLGQCCYISGSRQMPTSRSV